MENLLHASANAQEAEREIKLWFKPRDLPASMRAYPTEVCDQHLYHHHGKVTANFERGSQGLITPGEIVWRSDYEVLHRTLQGLPTETSCAAVTAKYLLNSEEDDA